MKKTLYLISIALTALAVSCVNLEEKNFSTMTAEEYYANFSDSDIPAAVGVLYSDLRYLYV